jgi:hypothetical protein
MLLAFLAAAAASGAAEPARDMPVFDPAPSSSQCPETPMSLARKMGKRPPQAIPLSKLPPAQTFMAVDRRIGGCEAPLTMVDYRKASRR